MDVHERMISKNPNVKDFTGNPIVKANVEEARNQFKRDNMVDGVKLLSEATERSKRNVSFGKELRIDKTKINREVKKLSKKQIDKAQEDSYEYLINNDYFQLNLSKVEENKRAIEELKEFNKLYFEKKEIQRLLKAQERNPNNFLPSQSQTQEDRDNSSQFFAYKQTQLQMKNERIQNMLEGGEKENRKLSLLISSGLLDTSKNIQQIIASSTELAMKDGETNNKRTSTQNPEQFEDLIIQDQEIDEEQSQLKLLDELIIESGSDFKETNNTAITQKLNEPASVEEYVNKITQMGLDITKKELSFVDLECLALFFQQFVASTPEEKVKTLSKIQMIESIRSFENDLFHKYRNGDIALRKKGRLEFKDLTVKEHLNYIKYNISKPSELFLMMQNIPRESLAPSTVSQSVSKLASFRFESKQNYLALIQNHNYRVLLHHCLNTLTDMEEIEFVDLVYSLGKIHKDEHGLVYERLFNHLMKATQQEIKRRCQRIQLKDLSFMLRGTVQLSHLSQNKEVNTILLSEIKNRLEMKEGEQLSIFALRGLMNYMAFLSNDESNHVMATYLLPLLRKEEIIQELDNLSLQEIFQSLASLVPTHKADIQQYVDVISPKIIEVSKQLSTDTISDIATVVSGCNLAPKSLFQELKKRTIFNLREQKSYNETSIPKIMCSFAQYDVVRSLQNNVDQKANQNTNLTDTLLLFSYFPTLVFHQQSPQYLFYERLAKEIDKMKFKLSQKWISMSIFGVASSQYKNFEFIDECTNQVLQFNDQMTSDNSNSKHNLSHLSMLLFAYSNIKRSNELSRKLLSSIREFYMEGKFEKATPISWAQFFNTLSNTSSEEELDEIEQQFAEVVFYDKIESILPQLTQNVLVSLFFSFSRLKANSEILSSFLQNIHPKALNNFQMYLLNISINLNPSLSLNQEFKQSIKQAYPRLKEIDQYMRKIVKEKQDFYGGQRFSFEQVQIEVKRIVLDLIKEGSKGTNQSPHYIMQDYFLEEAGFVIDFYLPNSRQAIFLYTYDQCLMQESTDKSVQTQNCLSGMFQARQKILRQQGIDVVEIFIQEFNKIGLKSSIEEEKKLKSKFIEGLLFKQK